MKAIELCSRRILATSADKLGLSLSGTVSGLCFTTLSNTGLLYPVLTTCCVIVIIAERKKRKKKKPAKRKNYV